MQPDRTPSAASKRDPGLSREAITAATTEPAVYVNGIYISGSLIAKSRGVAAKLEAEGNLYSAGVVRELATKLEAIRDAA